MPKRKRAQLRSAAHIIARFMRNARAPVNKFDPVTLEPLGAAPPYFLWYETCTTPTRSATTTFAFELKTLAQLLERSDVIVNPMTALPMDTLQRMRLQRAARRARIALPKEPSVSPDNNHGAGLRDAVLSNFAEAFEGAMEEMSEDAVHDLFHVAAFATSLGDDYVSGMFACMDRCITNNARRWDRDDAAMFALFVDSIGQLFDDSIGQLFDAPRHQTALLERLARAMQPHFSDETTAVMYRI